MHYIVVQAARKWGWTDSRLSLAREPVIAGHVLHKELWRSAGVALHKVDPQPIQAGKPGFGLRHQRPLPPAVHFAEQRIARERDHDDAGDGSPELRLLL